MERICENIVTKLEQENKTIAFMESCTGGFLANSITNISGASNVLKVSLVTYSNEYKIKFNVDKDIINEYTVYSTKTSEEMARRVAEFAKSNIGVGITGELGNTLSKENKVYYTIYNNDTKQCINKSILVEIDDRAKMKSEVAKNVFKTIIDMIK